MEKPAPTTEPKAIETLLAPALEKLRSQPVYFETQEEADQAWKLKHAKDDLAVRLIRAGYPERSVNHLGIMAGPGLQGAKDSLKALGIDGILVLIGERGPGKTQIATWIGAQRILDGGNAGMYRKALDMWQEIRATWRPGHDKTEDEVIRKFSKASFLVVDEAQERGDTEADRQWCNRVLTHIIDHRYDAMLPTLLVANLSVEAYEKTMPMSIRSRVNESGGVKVCDWPSYRV